MSVIRMIIAALLFVAAASAQAITVQSNAPSGLPISSPASIGKPHECIGYYPPDAAVELRAGKTIVAFTITAEGTVIQPKIVTYSYADLDEAALACVKTWTYRPATANGQPVATPWKVQVVWVAPAPKTPFEAALRTLRADAWRCLRSSAAAKTMPQDFASWLEVHIRFHDKAPSEITISQPSGNDALDKQSAECVRNAPSLAEVERQKDDRDDAHFRLAWWYQAAAQ